MKRALLICFYLVFTSSTLQATDSPALQEIISHLNYTLSKLPAEDIPQIIKDVTLALNNTSSALNKVGDLGIPITTALCGTIAGCTLLLILKPQIQSACKYIYSSCCTKNTYKPTNILYDGEPVIN